MIAVKVTIFIDDTLPGRWPLAGETAAGVAARLVQAALADLPDTLRETDYVGEPYAEPVSDDYVARFKAARWVLRAGTATPTQDGPTEVTK